LQTNDIFSIHPSFQALERFADTAIQVAWTDWIKQVPNLIIARDVPQFKQILNITAPFAQLQIALMRQKGRTLGKKHREGSPYLRLPDHIGYFALSDALEFVQTPVPDLLSCGIISTLHTLWFAG
jgi:hypothetical protein